MALFKQEMKITLKSLTYWLLVALLGGFVLLQMSLNLTPIKEPQPNETDYGMIPTTDKQLIQEQTYGRLLTALYFDNFTTYPLGFAKNIQLSDQETAEIASLLEAASGKRLAELFSQLEETLQGGDEVTPASYTMPLLPTHDYQQFEKDMKLVVAYLGRGSDYEEPAYLAAAKEPMSYQQAKTAFSAVVEKDHVSGAYARLLCDYFGIILGLLPVFLGATVMLRERRSNSQGVIYTQAVSSGKLLVTRYFSTVLLLLLPVLLFSLLFGLQTLVIAKQLGTQGDLLLYYGCLLGWLLPTILAVTGLSFLTTELFNGIVAVALQLAWWLFSVFTSGQQLVGTVGWNLIPRFNTVGQRGVFETIYPELLLNRIGWGLFGLGCCLLTIWLYDRQRKGGQFFGKKRATA